MTNKRPTSIPAHDQYKLPEQAFDAFNKENPIQEALGSSRTKSRKEVASLQSTNWVPGVSGWRLTPNGIEFGDTGDAFPPGSITFTDIQDISTARILGRTTASTGDIEQLTAAQVKTLLAIAVADVSGLASGTYTPTRSAESNLDANVTMTEAQYMRVGNTVTVSGRFTADATAGGLASFELTLPIASDIGAVEDVAGVATSVSATTHEGGEVLGVVANDTAKIEWIAVDTASRDWVYTFSYQII